MLTCENCNHTGNEVVPQPAHIGGKGYVTRHYCEDKLACWHRWDTANGLKPVAEIVSPTSTGCHVVEMVAFDSDLEAIRKAVAYLEKHMFDENNDIAEATRLQVDLKALHRRLARAFVKVEAA